MLVIAQGTDPDSLIEKGLSALGGIGLLVKKGSSVVIKPNYSVPRKPGEAATTNHLMLAALVKQCLTAGAKEVKVIDFPFGGPQCLVLSGIKEAVEKAGGKAFDIGKQSDFSDVDTGGVTLKRVMFSKDVLDADVLINFPILKHHQMTKVTMGLKGMMGLVQDRQYFHRTDLHQCIICGEQCPVLAIEGDEHNPPMVDANKCVGCGTCEKVCPVEGEAAIRILPKWLGESED